MSSHAPDDLQPWSIAVTASMTSLAFFCVCLRLLSRYERKQALWWDDYMIVFSMVCVPYILSIKYKSQQLTNMKGVEFDSGHIYLSDGSCWHGSPCYSGRC